MAGAFPVALRAPYNAPAIQKENEKKADAEAKARKKSQNNSWIKQSKNIDEEKPALSNRQIQSTIRTPLTAVSAYH